MKYTIEYKFSLRDTSSFTDALTKAQLADELEYLIDMGWHIVGVHEYVPSLDVSKCEAKAGDEDSFSNLGI